MATATEAPASSMAEGPTQHTPNQTAGLLKLREKFPADQIQALPKILCRNCSNDRNKVCGEHRKSKCNDCGNYITSSHLHLDYVGHAELTNRLLEADLLWDWEPVAMDQRGLPQFDTDGGLWIRLTVCGHSRLGYGDAQGKKGPNAVKEAIGDALRNAAMRFGAALDLWAKSDLTEAQTEHPKSEDQDRPAAEAAPRTQQALRNQAAAEPAAPADKVKEGHVDRLMGQVRECWDNALALAQIRGDAEKNGVINEQVQDPFGNWMPFHQLLDNRIAQKKASAGGERSAA